tara:strand:+ start:35755 stop:36888 length:1134 start_codon:yes stop_codon:yes gene_type:complete
MPHKQDDTLKDLNRREIAFPKDSIKEILPQFFRTEYPKLITLLDEYYHYQDDDSSPTRLINELFYNRDITQTDLDLLEYIEDELLLGQAYFEGFADKRAAAKYSNTLYRSKGTKYSIEQFFRTFFSIDPEVIYTKEQVFKLNGGDDFREIELEALEEASKGSPAFPATEYGQLDSDGARTKYQTYLKDNYRATSQIGFNSQKFLTNNKLYQQFAILVRSELSQSEWIQPYKLFVHPAGMFIGSEVQIISSKEDTITAPNVVIEPPPPVAITGVVSLADTAVSDVTSLVDDFNVDSAGIKSRIRTEFFNLNKLSSKTINEINLQYSSLREAQIASSPTLDDTSIDFSNNFDFETIDQDRHVFYSADSDQYLLNLGHLS